MRRTAITAIALGLIIAGMARWGTADDRRPPTDILFSHSLHVNALDLDCVFCHRTGDSETADDQLLPSEALCLTCHDGERAGSACQLCHRSADAPVGHPREQRLLSFAHKSHMELETVTCATCHDAVPTTVETQAGLPEMSMCLGCHDGIRQTIECAACHTNPDVVTRAIHPVGWRQDHRIAANINDPDCNSCHRTDDLCSLCHQGDDLTGTIHPFNWRTLHGVEARGRTTDCTACHDTELFCVDCHSVGMLKPDDHLGADWLARHGEEARFDVETCDACHGGSDFTCARAGCHDG